MTLERLHASRARMAAVLTGLVILVYFGFIGAVAWAKPFLARLLAPGLTVGILLGACVIVAAWLLTAAYVWWANRHYDPRVEDLRR